MRDFMVLSAALGVAVVLGCTTVPHAGGGLDDAGDDASAVDDTTSPPPDLGEGDSGVEADVQVELDVVAPMDVPMMVDTGPATIDRGPPAVDVPAVDIPFPSRACVRMPALVGSADATFRNTGTILVNQQVLGYRLADGSIIGLVLAVGGAGGVATNTPVTLGAGANANWGTCSHCVAVIFGCVMSASGNYECPRTALARSGTAVVQNFAGGASSRFAASVYNVVFEEIRIDPSTFNSTPLPGGECFTLDELSSSGVARVMEPIPQDSGAPRDTGAPVDTGSSGTGRPPLEEGSLRQLGGGGTDAGPPGPPYLPCTAEANCGNTPTPQCGLTQGIAQGVCYGPCGSDGSCPSYGVCGAAGACYRPCLAGGCSTPGFGCYSIRNRAGTASEVCVPQSWLDANPTTPCAGAYEGPTRECGWVSRVSYTCAPGTTLTVGCVAGGDGGAACSPLGMCNGDPVLRVCPGSAPCTYRRSLATVDDTCGTCPLATVSCPPEGRVNVLSGNYSNTVTGYCFVQRR